MLADTERDLSETQIERPLQEIEIADTSPGMTNWKRLFNALVGAQNQHQVGHHVYQSRDEPNDLCRQPTTFAWRHDERNVVLAFSGFYVRKNGRGGHADKATTLDSARALAGRLKAGPGKSGRARRSVNYCRAELLDENHLH